jgi:hypothetical protein
MEMIPSSEANNCTINVEIYSVLWNSNVRFRVGFESTHNDIYEEYCM